MFEELRRKNQALESMRPKIAQIGKALGLTVFAADTAASTSHLVADLEVIRRRVSVLDPAPLPCVALLVSVRHLVFHAMNGGKPHEQNQRDGARLYPQIQAELKRWPESSSRLCDEGSATEHFFEDEDPDPLHVRARAAIERLGLDGSRLELAVAVFGWGSDEANGSLLGLAGQAWETTLGATYSGGEWWLWPTDQSIALNEEPGHEVEDLLVDALEARQP